jgi:hypothetical protein
MPMAQAEGPENHDQQSRAGKIMAPGLSLFSGT